MRRISGLYCALQTEHLEESALSLPQEQPPEAQPPPAAQFLPDSHQNRIGVSERQPPSPLYVPSPGTLRPSPPLTGPGAAPTWGRRAAPAPRRWPAQGPPPRTAWRCAPAACWSSWTSWTPRTPAWVGRGRLVPHGEGGGRAEAVPAAGPDLRRALSGDFISVFCSTWSPQGLGRGRPTHCRDTCSGEGPRPPSRVPEPGSPEWVTGGPGGRGRRTGSSEPGIYFLLPVA